MIWSFIRDILIVTAVFILATNVAFMACSLIDRWVPS